MREPIDPADIRVGDRVERRMEWDGGDEIATQVTVMTVKNVASGGDRICGFGYGWTLTDGGEWFLLDRPDPLAEVVEVAAKALWGLGYTNVEWSYADPDVKIAYRDMARTVVAAIAERWELVRKRLGCE